MNDLTLDVTKIIDEIQRHLNDGRKGELRRQGVRTIILGPPNVGKSSFMNKICCKPISIVTNIAGTTRDIVESSFNISGYPVIIADTAGLRATPQDIVEQEGIARALDYARLAEMVILVLDAREFKDLQTFGQIKEKYLQELGIKDKLKELSKILIVVNKIDLLSTDVLLSMQTLNTENIVFISCEENTGISKAIDKIAINLKDL